LERTDPLRRERFDIFTNIGYLDADDLLGEGNENYVEVLIMDAVIPNARLG
jgi:hypothetical protein